MINNLNLWWTKHSTHLLKLGLKICHYNNIRVIIQLIPHLLVEYSWNGHLMTYTQCFYLCSNILAWNVLFAFHLDIVIVGTKFWYLDEILSFWKMICHSSLYKIMIFLPKISHFVQSTIFITLVIGGHDHFQCLKINRLMQLFI